MKERTSNIEKSKRFQELKRISGDPKCGDHNIMQDPNSGELLMRKVYMTNEPKTAQRYYEKFDARSLKNFPFLIQCYDFSFQIQSEFCSKYFVVHVYYEYPYDDLEKMLISHIKQSKPFTHEELMTLFYHALEALCHIETVSVGYGYLQPWSMFKDDTTGWFKLIDNFSNLGIREFYFNLITSAQQCKLFAPEVLRVIYQPSAQPIELPKVDIFHLGLILLSLGNLHPLNDIYDFDHSLILQDKLNAHIRTFEQKYRSFNPLLIEVIHQLLILDPKQRPVPSAVRKFFPSYDHFQSAIISKSQIRHKSLQQGHIDQYHPSPQTTNPFQFKFQTNYK